MGRLADHVDEETLKLLAGLDEAQDLRASWAALRQRIDQLQSSGHDVPRVLVDAERRVIGECMAQSQGR